MYCDCCLSRWPILSHSFPACSHLSASIWALHSCLITSYFLHSFTIWCRHRNNVPCIHKCTTCWGHSCIKTMSQQETTLFITQVCFFSTNVLLMVLPSTKLRAGLRAILSLNPWVCSWSMAKSCNSMQIPARINAVYETGLWGERGNPCEMSWTACSPMACSPGKEFIPGCL